MRCNHIAILDIGGRDAQTHHQTECINRDVALLALCFLARIAARGINVGPRFRDEPLNSNSPGCSALWT